jgi:tetratricopeptide (TPR) repeat protein
MRRIWPYILVLQVVSAAPVRAEDSPEWTQCTARPTAELTDDTIVAACTSVLDAAKEPPDRLATAAFGRSLAYNRKRQGDKANADLDLALHFDPKFAKAYLARGYDAVTNGKFDAGIKQFDQAIAIDPKLPDAYYGRGLAYDASRQFDRAIKDEQQAIRLNPKYAQAYFGLGLTYHDKGQLDRAIENFSKAIELDPQYAQALYNRGNAYGARNQIDRAITDYNAAIQIEPDYAKALFMRGLAYQEMGKTDQALADLEAAVRIDPKFAKAIAARDELKSRIASTTPAPSGQEEETVFALYLARSGNQACGFGVDDAEKTALDHELTERLGKAGISADRARQLEARAEAFVAQRKQTDAKFCAPDGAFAGNAHEMFDAVADRPKPSR